ncbi:MAG: DUF2461 family protein [Clostridia bacterium]|nr:DUF2461 family protein [Clostridia bacterium]
MFNGFNKKTIEILDSLKFNNNKPYYNSIKEKYTENVTKPLKLLSEDLIEVLRDIDIDLVANTRYCVSTPFADARFNKAKPIKEYVYLRYRINPQKSSNVLGYFFDASPEGMKYGLKLYKASPRGVRDIGDELLWENLDVLNALAGKGYLLTMGGSDEHEERFSKVALNKKEWVKGKDFMLYKKCDIEDTFFERALFDKISADFCELKNVYYILKDTIVL